LGFATNFNAELDKDHACTPQGSRSLSHGEWIDDESGFPEEPRWVLLQLHADGEDILSREAIQRVFQAVHLVRNNSKYAEICAEHETPIVDQETGNFTCPIHSVLTFWNNSEAIFNNRIGDDDECIEALSNTTYPNGETVDRPLIMGYAKADDTSNKLLSAKSFVVTIAMTPADEDKAEDVEKKAIDAILDLQEEWAAEPGNRFKIEVNAYRSFGDEFSRAITKDLPLIPMVFVVMVILCCLVFHKRDRVQSRSLLGFGAVCTVLLAIMTGYGMLMLYFWTLFDSKWLCTNSCNALAEPNRNSFHGWSSIFISHSGSYFSETAASTASADLIPIIFLYPDPSIHHVWHRIG